MRQFLRCAILLSFALTSVTWAQVGGVRIDADGILAFDAKARRSRAKQVDISEDLATRSDLRQISIKQLDREVRAALDRGGDLPDELRFLAGLSAIDYIIFDRPSSDVRIAGPAEGWKIESDGRPVAASTGRAILHLEDLALALRIVLNGNGKIECSIDPTQKGLAAVQPIIAAPWKSRSEGSLRQDQIRESLGRQVVTVKGVPPGSRFGRTIVEADYLMKQIAIGAVRIRGISNHLDALVEQSKNGSHSISLIRWWFTSDYQPPATNASRSVWQIRGRRMQLQNEEMMLAADGSRAGKGANSQKDRFSTEFTEALPSLETKYALFSDLRNLYDLVFVAALIRQQGATEWLENSILLDPDALPTPIGTDPRFAENVVTYEFHKVRDLSGRLANMATVAFGGVAMDAGQILGPTATGDLFDLEFADFSAGDPSEKASDTGPEGESTDPPWWKDTPVATKDPDVQN